MATQTPWYRTGTVAVTASSKSVTGTGSAWQSQVLAGDLFALTDANGNLTTALAEVESIGSDTALTLKAQWPGSTLSGQKYAIIRNFTGSLPADLAARLSKLIAQYQISVDEITELLTSSGAVTLTTLTGETVSVQGLAGITTRLTAVESALSAKLDDSQATAAGLALLGAANVAAQRSALGLTNHQLLSVDSNGVARASAFSSAISGLVSKMQAASDGCVLSFLDGDVDETATFGWRFVSDTTTGDLRIVRRNGSTADINTLRLSRAGGRAIFGNIPDNGNDLLQLAGAISTGAVSGKKFYSYNSGAIQSGIGVDLSGNGYEVSFFSGYNGGYGRFSWGGYTPSSNSYAEMMALTPSGKLGLGEANPSTELVIRKDAAGALGPTLSLVNYSGTTVGNSASINFGLEASTYDGDNCSAQVKAVVTDVTAASALTFSTWNGTAFGERERITAAGRHLFGTTTDNGTDIAQFDGSISTTKGVTVPNCADDAAAATVGVPVGAIYRTGTTLKVRAA